MKGYASRYSIVLPYLLVFGVCLLRLEVSHPANFIPIFSCLLFFAAHRPAREFAAPLIALIGVDIYLTTQRYGYPLTSGHGVTWLCYLAVLFMGAEILKNSLSTSRAIGTSLLASVGFFVVSNFTVWAEWGMYPKTFAGLQACYFAALPFFRNSAISESVCSLLLFGLSGYATKLMPAARRMQSVCS